MSREEQDQERPALFARWSFRLSAALLGLIGVGAAFVVIANLGDAGPRGDSAVDGTPSASVAATVADRPSVCGLPGVRLDGTVTVAPAAIWEYEGTTAYPVSQEFGPAAEAQEGYRYCFQHSPEGALFAAANALAAPATGTPAALDWSRYFLAPGAARGDLLPKEKEPSSSAASTRITMAGFRFLSYDGTSAVVDLGGYVAAGTSSAFSAVYHLDWVDGDWKLNTDSTFSFSFTAVPNLTGYTPWTA